MNDGDEEIVLDKLKIALDLVETLKSENEAYKDNFDQLKVSHDRLQDRFDGMSREFEVTLKEKSALENQCAEQETQYKLQIATKTKEVDELRNAGPKPKDIELLRLKITDELEKQQQKKWALLSKETEKYRESYYKLRRDHELVKADYERVCTESETVQEELKHAHQEEIKAYESKLNAVRESLENMSDITRLHAAQRENLELQTKLKNLLSELEEIRAEKENLRIEYEQQERNSRRKLTDEVAHAKMIAAEKEGLQAKLSSLENHMVVYLRQQDQLTEENARLAKELDKTRNTLEETIHKFNVESSDLKMTAVKERNEAQNALNDVKQKLNEVKSSLKTSNETVHELRQRLSTHEKESLERLQLVREEEWEKISRLEAEKCALEKKLALLTQENIDITSSMESHKSDLLRDMSQLKKEVQTLFTTNESLSAQLQNAVAEREKAIVQTEELRARVADAESRLAEASRDVEAGKGVEMGLRQKISSLELSLQSTQGQVTQLTEHLEKERVAYQHDMERHRSNWAKEKYALQQRLDDARRERGSLLERMEDLERTLEQHSKQYRAKITQWKQKVDKYRVEVHNLRKSLTEEKEKAALLAHETRQRHTDFMLLLQSEGMLTIEAPPPSISV
ncbi:hypothetical protein HDV00_003147 [Rhizophlyctis rosea]|nr:hypothetical protein HDV00_003147 [Rhizophlyctis rosea]